MPESKAGVTSTPKLDPDYNPPSASLGPKTDVILVDWGSFWASYLRGDDDA